VKKIFSQRNLFYFLENKKSKKIIKRLKNFKLTLKTLERFKDGKLFLIFIFDNIFIYQKKEKNKLLNKKKNKKKKVKESDKRN